MKAKKKEKKTQENSTENRRNQINLHKNCALECIFIIETFRWGWYRQRQLLLITYLSIQFTCSYCCFYLCCYLCCCEKDSPFTICVRLVCGISVGVMQACEKSIANTPLHSFNLRSGSSLFHSSEDCCYYWWHILSEQVSVRVLCMAEKGNTAEELAECI